MTMKKQPKPKGKLKELKKAVATLTDVAISMSSVELTRTTGGEVRPKVKVYDMNPDKALAKAMELMDKANKVYRVSE